MATVARATKPKAKTHKLQAPFPYFGGKSRASDLVWSRFGDVRNYVEPFAGSLAVLLGRPTPFPGTETVNDLDGFISNFWRAVRADPQAVVRHADHPVFENDLHARHSWLVERKESLQARLEGDPDWYDAKIAGWWCWGACCWIGSGWCSGEGPWHRVEVAPGRWELRKEPGDAGTGVQRQRVNLGDAGQGVRRKLVHLGDAGTGINRQLVNLLRGRGVQRQRVNLGDAGRGVNRKHVHLLRGRGVTRSGVYSLPDWMTALAERLRRVRVCCGDWSRVCGPTPTVKMGLTAVFLDPPYADTAGRDARCYRVDSLSIAHAVREWAVAHGDDPRMRICLAGYENEHKMPRSWECVPWKAKGGYGGQSSQHDNPNARRERLWFSPSCLRPKRVIGAA